MRSQSTGLPAARSRRQSGAARRLLPLAALGAVLLLCAVPRPYYIVKPGFALDAAGLLPPGQAGSGKGSWLYTAIRVDDASAAEAVAAWLFKGRQVMEKRVLLRGESEADYMAGMKLVMEASQADAAEAAYRLSGTSYLRIPEKVVVLEGGRLGKGAELAAGDLVTSCAGSPVESLSGLAACLDAAAARGGAGLELARGSRTITVHVDMNRDELRAYAEGLRGMAAGREGEAGTEAEKASAALAAGAPTWGEVRVIKDEETGLPLEWKEASAGGPSAGLMMALAVYDRLTAGDGTGGLKVAGTGTMSPDGSVGAVGGVVQKVAAAAAAGAELFLVPPQERREAEASAMQLHTPMKIAAAATLEAAAEAVAAQARLRE
ncbi:S16 family serine protease [Paenibacillus sp. D51F]